MSISQEEREHVRETVAPILRSEDDFRQLMHEKVFDFLKRKNRFSTIQDNILFVQRNKYRPYDAITITKFLTADLEPFRFIESVFSKFTPPFIVFVDSHFLCETKPNKDEENRSDDFKLQTGSKASSMNDTVKVVTEGDFTSLMDEFRHLNHSDLLSESFRHHCELYEYENSGLRPFQLLCLLIHIQKFPVVE